VVGLLHVLEGQEFRGAQRRVQEANFLFDAHALLGGSVAFGKPRVDRRFVADQQIVKALTLQQLRRELLEVTKLVSEESDVRHSSGEPLAHAEACDLGVLVELGVVGGAVL